MPEKIRIPIDLISYGLVGAGGFPNVIIAGQTYELFASGDLARLQLKARTKTHGGVRVQPEQAKKDLQ